MKDIKKINYHFFHGWGFNQRFWNPVISELSLLKNEIKFFNYDFGFFGNENLPVKLDESKINIFISHSYALNWILKKNFRFDFLINFFGSPKFFKKHTNEKDLDIVKKMLINLETKPKSVLSVFYKNCGLKNFFDKTQKKTLFINVGKLKKSLLFLRDDNLLKEFKRNEKKIFSIFSKSDKILLYSNYMDLFNKNKNSTLIFSDAEHAWPNIDPVKVTNLINEIVQLKKYRK